jgi:hypothetical protein
MARAEEHALAKDTYVEVINLVIEALEHEHECFKDILVGPITAFINECIGEPCASVDEVCVCVFVCVCVCMCVRVRVWGPSRPSSMSALESRALCR